MDTTLSKTTRSSEDGSTLRQQGDADLLSDPEVIAILKRLREGPINKNGVVKSDSGSGKDMIPYGLATKLLAAGWMQQSRQYHHGLVATSIPTWDITAEGRDVIDAIEPRAEPTKTLPDQPELTKTLPEENDNGPQPDWIVIPDEGCLHVIPRREWWRHIKRSRGFVWNCSCHPSPSREDCTIIIHNSFYGLPRFESQSPAPSAGRSPPLDRLALKVLKDSQKKRE